jgi:hypothetical protein
MISTQSPDAFEQMRRQQLLPKVFYVDTVNHLRHGLERFQARMQDPSLDDEDRALLSASQADFCYQALSLRYTAGEAIEPLRSDLERTVIAYEQHAKFIRIYEQEPKFPALRFRHISDYQRCMQLIGLCYLLHRRDLLTRIAILQDPNYYGHDSVYEELLDYALSERYDTEDLFHLKPYEHLIDAMYAETDDGSITSLGRYCLEWYPAMADAPWHGAHERINGTEGDYFGYWAFEAGAVAYLLDLDDSSITHMVYPKDLVAWARANKHLSERDAMTQQVRLRCEANHPCPREGFWFTPAQADSRRFFKAGELMPEAGGDYGTTIWQWDENQ